MRSHLLRWRKMQQQAQHIERLKAERRLALESFQFFMGHWSNYSNYSLAKQLAPLLLSSGHFICAPLLLRFCAAPYRAHQLRASELFAGRFNFVALNLCARIASCFGQSNADALFL